MTGQLAFLVPLRHPRPANYVRGANPSRKDSVLRPSLPYSDPDDPSIRLAYSLDKQIFDMNILIVVNLLEKKQPDLLHYL